MWILPKQYFQSLPEAEASKLDLNALDSNYELPLMWRSKPSLLATWLRRWKRATWTRLLFGRMLKPSISITFVEKYTESLPDIHVSRLAMQANDRARAIPDTCGRLYSESLSTLNPNGAFLKTWKDILHSDSMKYQEIYAKWVTKLRQDYTRRKKLVHHTSENGSSSSQSWATPQSRDFKTADLPHQKNYQRKIQKGYTIDLNSQVLNWPTVTVQDASNCAGKSQQKRNTLPLNVVAGHPDPDNPNTLGKHPGQLNPEWVAQLMGTTLESTFFVCTAMELYRKQPQKQ
jgi:hypothetical protein